MITPYIRFDWAIKKIKRNKADYGVLEGFLSVLLGKEITINKFLESKLNQNDADNKYNRVDILCEESTGELVIIEIQNTQSSDYFHRMLFGASKAISERLNIGEDYSHVKKVYSINIVYFHLGQGEDYVYHGKTELVGMHDNDVLLLSRRQKEAFKITTASDIFPEYYVLKVNDFDKVTTSPMDEWISFLKTGDIPEDFSAIGLPEAREKLRYDRLDENDKREYRKAMDQSNYEKSVIENILAEREARREAKGRAAEKIDIAKNMISLGLPPEIIAQSTGLPLEVILSLSDKS